MGLDVDLFVGPVSEHLLCPICQDVLVNPVETPCQHLFCESELLEFYAKTGRTTCPVDNMALDPQQIKKPGRVVLSLLAELVRYCEHRKEGCTWKGKQDALKAHLSTCGFNRDLLREKDERIARLEQLLAEKETIIDAVHDKLAVCKQENRYLREKLRVVEELMDPLYADQVLVRRDRRAAREVTAEGSASSTSSGSSNSGSGDEAMPREMHRLNEEEAGGSEDDEKKEEKATSESEGEEEQVHVCPSRKALQTRQDKTSLPQPITDLQGIARLRKLEQQLNRHTALEEDDMAAHGSVKVTF